MERILKFRAWDSLGKKFISPDAGYQGHYTLSLNGSFFNLQNGSGGDEYIVQQSTGLIDLKGVEIFEGDIVETRTGKPHDHFGYGEVVWEQNLDLVPAPQWGVRFLVPNVGFCGDLRGKLLVVGNIFRCSIASLKKLSEEKNLSLAV